MSITRTHLKALGLIVFTGLVFTSCKKNDDDKVSLRTAIDSSSITGTSTYSSIFVDANAQSTVDFTEGGNAYKAFQAINNYCSLSKTQAITAAALVNMYSNTGNPFTDAALNTSGVQLRNLTASSWNTTAAEVVRAKFASDFTTMGSVSQSFATTASDGVAGKLGGAYIVDAKGIETQQVIQKGLIGAYQLDLICNVLLDEGLNAENYAVVSGKNYTQLEHNWDLAFATLTPNTNYLIGSTASAKGTTEFALGSYAWEYNRDTENYKKILPAFIKGRVAIVNNNKAQINVQALLIKQILQKTIALAARGYLAKSKDATLTEAQKAHAFGEGLGFIYSLRFCTAFDADASFSDSILAGLIGSTNTFYNLTPAKILAADDAIKAKFKL
ncbi:DUF4856 domain-containing protein [Pedobacter sp. P351]|uniref:DUF4856 domain-containing protein n=1 Tax=Pedobacter superstes TaxID=3133441 RepID=UPI00309E047C